MYTVAVFTDGIYSREPRKRPAIQSKGKIYGHFAGRLTGLGDIRLSTDVPANYIIHFTNFKLSRL